MKEPIRKLMTQRARRYLDRSGILSLLMKGDSNEIPADLLDLANLHRAVRRLQPLVILEFGVGFSTIILAHALKQNGGGRLYGIDADAKWIDNLCTKLPPDIAPLVDLRHSGVEIALHNGAICHFYESLPNVVPDFIYLDGPSHLDVRGSIRGLSFQPENGQVRQQVAADILLYESTMQKGATIMVDSRYMNVHFLRHSLRRDWLVKIDRLRRQTTFTLQEHTSRQ
jgi:hypothetical protein